MLFFDNHHEFSSSCQGSKTKHPTYYVIFDLLHPPLFFAFSAGQKKRDSRELPEQHSLPKQSTTALLSLSFSSFLEQPKHRWCTPWSITVAATFLWLGLRLIKIDYFFLNGSSSYQIKIGIVGDLKLLIMDLEIGSRQNHIRVRSVCLYATICWFRGSSNTPIWVVDDGGERCHDRTCWYWIGYLNLGSIDWEIQTIGA